MAEQRTDEQMMTGRDMQLSPDAEADRPSEGLSTCCDINDPVWAVHAPRSHAFSYPRQARTV